MNIIYDHQIFAMQEHGGVSRYFIELAKQFSARSDIELNLLAPVHFNQYIEELGIVNTRGYRAAKFPMAGKMARLVNSFITQLWLRKHEPDIHHATYYFPVKRKHTNKAKVVVTVHDMIYELFPGDFSAADRTAQLKHDAVLRSDHVICVSNNTKKDLIELTGVDPVKVSVVHHGVNRLMQSPAVDVKLPGKGYFLYVGKRDGYKNFSCLLSAFAECTELSTQFDLVCFGGGGFSSEELATQKFLGLRQGCVHWFGGSDAVLAKLYENATVFIYPSLYEGFGMPVLEAMSLNCPVICSSGGSIPEVVGEAGVFFDPLNPSELLDCIEKVANDSLFADELRLRGVKQTAKYSWARCADETLKIYRSLIS